MDSSSIHRRITPYSLRHAYATYSVQSGAKLKPLAKIMGHRNEIMILRTYQHVLDKDEREAVEAMPDVLRLGRPAMKRRGSRRTAQSGIWPLPGKAYLAACSLLATCAGS